MEQAQQEHLGGRPEVRLWSGVCGHPAPAEPPRPGGAHFSTRPPARPRSCAAPGHGCTSRPGEKEGFRSSELTPSTDGWEPAPLGPCPRHQS